MERNRAESGFTLIEMMFVVGLIGVISAIAIPMMTNGINNFKLTGDVRGVSNSIALAKMRAASSFARVRLYVDLGGHAYHVESWNSSTSHWTTEGGTTYLSSTVSFGYGPAATPPANTQGTIGEAPVCTNDAGTAIDGTACVMFNSRGIPVDSTLAPTAADAIYVTDGTAVYGVTVAATGMTRTWRSNYTSTPHWVLN